MKCVKLEGPKLWRQVQTSLVPRRGEGVFFAGNSPVVDTNDRCGGLVTYLVTYLAATLKSDTDWK
jgi:hypothetical protein